jgi:hypothetical protein
MAAVPAVSSNHWRRRFASRDLRLVDRPDGGSARQEHDTVPQMLNLVAGQVDHGAEVLE